MLSLLLFTGSIADKEHGDDDEHDEHNDDNSNDENHVGNGVFVLWHVLWFFGFFKPDFSNLES